MRSLPAILFLCCLSINSYADPLDYQKDYGAGSNAGQTTPAVSNDAGPTNSTQANNDEATNSSPTNNAEVADASSPDNSNNNSELISRPPVQSRSVQAFPPQYCNGSELRVMGWQEGYSTACITGQEVMQLAIPTCAEGATVVKQGGKFICKKVPKPASCGPNEFLTFDGTNYTCGQTSVPTCGANEVLTFNGSGFICVAKTDEIPTCAQNEFLTYNGTSFQCAATQTLSVPDCAAGEMLTKSGGEFQCVRAPSLQLGLQFVGNVCYNSNTCYAVCPSGKQALSGGCFSNRAYGLQGGKSVGYGWQCIYSGDPPTDIEAHVVCVNEGAFTQ